jgi:arsenite methyltransferase
MSTEVNRNELESKIQAMYRDVAQNPHGEFHFEMGRALAERLGYRPADLDRIPGEAIDSFAGVGYYFHFLDEMEGARVLDLGSGSGMDSFIASLITGPSGTVIGLDMTDAQRVKAEALRQRHGMRNVTFVKGYIDAAPFEDGSFDVLISNGVINLAVDKPQVFREAARLLRSGSRLAIADIVTTVELPETIACNTTLWAACIGGAAGSHEEVRREEHLAAHRQGLNRRTKTIGPRDRRIDAYSVRRIQARVGAGASPRPKR